MWFALGERSLHLCVEGSGGENGQDGPLEVGFWVEGCKNLGHVRVFFRNPRESHGGGLVVTRIYEGADVAGGVCCVRIIQPCEVASKKVSGGGGAGSKEGIRGGVCQPGVPFIYVWDRSV